MAAAVLNRRGASPMDGEFIGGCAFYVNLRMFAARGVR